MRAEGGSRVEWDEIPTEVRAAVEGALGATVLAARNERGGFSPGLAARCALSDGGRAFIKAVSAAQNPLAPRIHRREAEVAALLPASVPAPELRHVHDDGDWVVLVFDEVAGHQPAEPWRWADLDVVIPAVLALGTHRAPDGLQSAADRHRAAFDGWRRLSAGDGDVDRLDPWTASNLDLLARIETEWDDASRGTALVHADVRADNLLVDDRGGVTVVDWPWACVGAPFLDAVFLLPSVGLGGGPPPTEVVARYGLFDAVDDAALLAAAVALAGFFRRAALDPPPPGLPHLRAFQAAQGDVARDWVRELLRSRAT
jgi:aminoglycoside phosphotransferase (APT) family kinase protein